MNLKNIFKKLFKRKEVYVCPDWDKIYDIVSKPYPPIYGVTKKAERILRDERNKGLSVRHGNITHSINEPCKLCNRIKKEAEKLIKEKQFKGHCEVCGKGKK
jgi:hypothetical protein